MNITKLDMEDLEFFLNKWYTGAFKAECASLICIRQMHKGRRYWIPTHIYGDHSGHNNDVLEELHSPIIAAIFLEPHWEKI